jgi:ADP-ribosylglycohydrolase
MRTAGTHRDTYVEEYHRHFFTNFARGKMPRSCGCQDVHIGGLAQIPALIDALRVDPAQLREIVQDHVALTHQDKDVLRAADDFVRILLAVRAGTPLRQAILGEASDWISAAKVSRWVKEPDQVVIGHHLSPACYIPDAFPASLYLAWRYADDFSSGICANAQVGGDSCHRGAVVGALLGESNGVPSQWIEGLQAV